MSPPTAASPDPTPSPGTPPAVRYASTLAGLAGALTMVFAVVLILAVIDGESVLVPALYFVGLTALFWVAAVGLRRLRRRGAFAAGLAAVGVGGSGDMGTWGQVLTINIILGTLRPWPVPCASNIPAPGIT